MPIAPKGGQAPLLSRTVPLIRDLLEFCYPGACAACARATDAGGILCADCEAALAQLESAAACARCAAPLPLDDAPCPRCLGKGLRPFDRIVRVGVFSDPLRALIHQIKYHHRWNLIEFLAGRMLARSQLREVLEQADCVVPVPLHPMRHLSRGYNQAALLADRLVRGRRRVRICSAVVRLRHTETQTHLHSKMKRMANLRGAFGLVDPGAIRGRNVTVIDDVMTTGATLLSVARTLRAAQPASLNAIVIAIADPARRDFQSI